MWEEDKFMIVEVITMSLWELCRKRNIIGLIWGAKSEARQEEQSFLILIIKFIFPKSVPKGHVFFNIFYFREMKNMKNYYTSWYLVFSLHFILL